MAVFTYKCPNCDGGLEFNAAKQKFVCEYCMSEFTMDELKAHFNEEELSKQAEQDAKEEREHIHEHTHNEEDGDMLMYNCPSCGAEIVTDATTAASFCYYCHNPVVLSGRLAGEYKPDLVIPFTIERKEAENRLLEWIKTKKLAPNDFYGKENIEKMSGVYFPFFLVSEKINGNLNAESHNVRTWISGDTEHTERNIYHVAREGTIILKNITKNALNKEEKVLVDNVLPFDMKKSKPFSMAYLSGFFAEKRNLEIDSFKEEIKAEVMQYTENILRDTLDNYDELHSVHVETHVKARKNQYALMPVWVLTYKGNDKIYYYAMNGQTGKICGDVPISMKKLLIRFLCVAAPIFAALCILGGLLL